mgnify:CR=1 FL=1
MSDFWTACLEQIKNDTPRDVFQTWFADLTADVELEAGSITILAPSGAKLRTVRDSYGTTITQYVNRQAGKEMDIVWAVAQSKPQRPFAEHVEENKPDIAATGLLPNLTFENLVEGQANQMAFASALQVASSTHSVYNPLFIYGGVGLGKTHLMHAIGNRFLKNNPKAKVLCVSAQQYTQEFVDAMRLKNVNSERYTEAMRKFDARYRGIDMLLIDDIQSFRDREGTQTNFFLTFESMVPHGKQIVLTSDTYPKNLSEFQDRLLSRLTQGLIVMIEPPEFEMRVQILLQKAERSGINMPQDVAEIIAKRIKSNVRELEGAVQQILAYTRFHQVPVTLDTAKMAHFQGDGYACYHRQHPESRCRVLRHQTERHRRQVAQGKSRSRPSGRHVPVKGTHQQEPAGDRRLVRRTRPYDGHLRTPQGHERTQYRRRPQARYSPARPASEKLIFRYVFAAECFS